MNQTIQTIQNHRSIRSFETRPIEKDKLDAILHSAYAMPTSINGQQVSVIVVKDTQKKAKLAEIAGGQFWIDVAPVFLVFVADFYKTHLAGVKTGNTQIIHESVEGTIVGTFDGGLAMGAAIISAESLGLGIVPIGGIRKDPQAVIDLLDLPPYTFPLAGLAIGYPTDTSKKKPRLPFETFAHDDGYNKDGLQVQIDQYDTEMVDYLASINRTQEVNWSHQTANVYKKVYFPLVHPVLKIQGFKNDK